MAALASIADVKRVMHRDANDTSLDDVLTAALQAATELVTKYLRRDFTQSAPATQVYYDVREDSLIALPLPGATVQAVRFYRTASATAYNGVVQTDYEVHADSSMLRLHPTFFDVPFEGAVSAHLPGNWSRIEVDYTPPTTIPTPVRDGVALTAAAIHVRGPITISGFTGEHIGDYSYSARPLRGQFGASEAIPEVAKALLRPYKKRNSLVP